MFSTISCMHNDIFCCFDKKKPKNKQKKQTTCVYIPKYIELPTVYMTW